MFKPRKPVFATNEQAVKWLSERDPIRSWSVGDKVFCRSCRSTFVAFGFSVYLDEGPPCSEWLPECPYCKASPLDWSRVGDGDDWTATPNPEKN